MNKSMITGTVGSGKQMFTVLRETEFLKQKLSLEFEIKKAIKNRINNEYFFKKTKEL
ncbi:hypothetical protein [Vibrio campbellii]